MQRANWHIEELRALKIIDRSIADDKYCQLLQNEAAQQAELAALGKGGYGVLCQHAVPMRRHWR